VAGAHYAMSLDAPVTSADTDDPGCLVDTVGGADGGFALVDMTASLDAAIACLPYQERRALALRLQGGRKQTRLPRRRAAPRCRSPGCCAAPWRVCAK
jgi:hypothetical protein